jgi:hypothetical protein
MRSCATLLLLLVACGPRYTQPNTTEVELRRDLRRCQGESNWDTRNLTGSATEAFMDACMRHKGWTVDGQKPAD